MSQVQLINVRKVYPNGHAAISNASLTIEDGEFAILVGPSGCGKSTLLRMIAGLEELSSGEIRIGGRNVNRVPPKNRNIAMVFQNYALYPHMTVRGNLGFALRQAKLGKAEIARRIAGAADILGLEDLLERKPGEISGGQRQRVAVGRAIVRDADVFLFDEPLSNLDANLRTQMRAELAKLHQRLGKTMIYVTHDQMEAMTMADRMVVVNRGEVLQFDTPLEIYRHPANEFVAGFIGTPAMNRLRGRIEAGAGGGADIGGGHADSDGAADIGGGGALQFADERGAARIALPESVAAQHGLAAGAEVVFGIRPEDIHPALESGAASGSAGAGGGYAPLRLWVDLVEPMGNEAIIHGKLNKADDRPLLSRGRFDSLPAEGGWLEFRLDLSRACFFDGRSGESLRR